MKSSVSDTFIIMQQRVSHAYTYTCRRERENNISYTPSCTCMCVGDPETESLNILNFHPDD